MNILFVLAVVFATASAFTLSENKITPRNIVVPVAEPEGRITNGKDAEDGQFPYQVGLTLTVGSATYWCGGSLISDRWVLTAAHCTHSAESVEVYLGATTRTSPEVTFTVTDKDIIIHSGWEMDTLKHDISLIRIPAVTFSDRIQPVKLPSIASSYSSYAGDTAIASGWGKTSDGIFAGTPIRLQYAPMPIITNSRCAKTFGQLINPKHICVATNDAVSPCHGDSGGPLVLESSMIQIGLTSFGSDLGCTKGHPGVFTRVTSYLDWIKANTGISH